MKRPCMNCPEIILGEMCADRQTDRQNIAEPRKCRWQGATKTEETYQRAKVNFLFCIYIQGMGPASDSDFNFNFVSLQLQQNWKRNPSFPFIGFIQRTTLFHARFAMLGVGRCFDLIKEIRPFSLENQAKLKIKRFGQYSCYQPLIQQFGQGFIQMETMHLFLQSIRNASPCSGAHMGPVPDLSIGT